MYQPDTRMQLPFFFHLGPGREQQATDGLDRALTHATNHMQHTHGIDPRAAGMASGHGHGSSNAGAPWDGDSLNYLDVLREVYSSLVRTVASSSATHTHARGFGGPALTLDRIVPTTATNTYTTELPWGGARRKHGARQQQPR